MNKQREFILGSILTLWLLIVITAFNVVQKPWPLNGSLRAVQALLDTVLAAVVVVIGGGLGRKLFGTFPKLHPHEEVSLQAGLGLGILSFVVFAVGVAGFFGSVTAWLLLLVGILWLRRPIFAWVKDIQAGFLLERPTGLVANAAMLVLTILLLASFLEALAPPLKWDSLVYHLALPQKYLQAGQIKFVSSNLFVGFPQLAEMLYMWAIALGSGTTAAVLGWFVGVIAVLGLAGLGRRIFGSVGWWMTPAVLLSGSSLWQGLTWAYVDHWVLLYGLILLISLDNYSLARQDRWLWLAGAAIGFAASSKYTGGILGLAAVLWISSMDAPALLFKKEMQSKYAGTGTPVRSVSWKELARKIAILTLTAMVLFSPWLLKNWLTTGNPLYPFLFPGRELDSLRQTFHAQGDSTLTPFHIPLLPWLATVLGVEGGAGFNSSIGPLYLALLPGLLLGLKTFDDRVRSFLRKVGWVVLLGWVLWGLGAVLADPLSRSRHYYGFLPSLALLAVAGYRNMMGLELKGIRINWVISRLVLFSIMLTGIAGMFHIAKVNPLPVIVGQQAEQEFIADQLGWYGPAMAYLDNLPPDAKVEMLWEARSYYCPRECRPDVILDKWWYWQRTMESGEAIGSELQDQGVSHILIYDFGAEFERRTRDLLLESDWQALVKFRQNQLQLIETFGNGYSLYTWRE